MDCDALQWYEQQDEALQTRIRMLARYTATLKGADWRCFLPGASKGASHDRVMFDQIVDQLVAPLLSKRNAMSGEEILGRWEVCGANR